MRHLMRMAAEMGIRVHGAYLDDEVFGYYSPDESRIYFDLRLTPVERICTIAHELGHAHHGHGCDSETHERQAQTFAAELLIDPAEYALVEQVSAETEYMAEELGITPELVSHYRRYVLQRLGQRTYSTKPLGRFTNAIAREIMHG